MKTALIALLMLPMAGAINPVIAQQQEPTAEQKAFIQAITAFGRIQAACSLHNSELLHPGVTKKFIESQFKSLPDQGKQMRAELKKQDPNCYGVLN